MNRLRTFLTFVLLSFFLVSIGTQTYAQETIVLTTSPTPHVVKSIDYAFPFPGMLPTNPLYFLKIARDQVIGLLITDPAKKASFDLLQAEKRFQAGIMLYQQNPSKKDLALDSISKSQNYLEEAVQKFSDAQKQGVELSDLGPRLLLSAKKQEQLLTDLTTSHPSIDSDKSVLQRLQKIRARAELIVQSSQDKIR